MKVPVRIAGSPISVLYCDKITSKLICMAWLPQLQILGVMTVPALLGIAKVSTITVA